jgi:Na+-driven multidrug efflux pump
MGTLKQDVRWITRDRSFYRSLIFLAVPVTLQNLLTFSVSFADNLMVGSLGDAAMSGVFMGNQMQTFLQMVSGGIEGTGAGRTPSASSASWRPGCAFPSPLVYC